MRFGDTGRNSLGAEISSGPIAGARVSSLGSPLRLKHSIMTTVASGFRQRGTGPAGTTGHHLTTCTRAHGEEPQCEERIRVNRAPTHRPQVALLEATASGSIPSATGTPAACPALVALVRVLARQAAAEIIGRAHARKGVQQDEAP
jgi:hypothetical protein